MEASLMPVIIKLTARFTVLSRNGLTLLEGARFAAEATIELVLAVEEMQHLSGAQKKALVITTLRQVWEEKGIDLPGIPSWIEPMVVGFLFDNMVPVLCDTLVSLFKRIGFFRSTSRMQPVAKAETGYASLSGVTIHADLAPGGQS